MKRIAFPLILLSLALWACNPEPPSKSVLSVGPKTWIDFPLNSTALALAPIDIISHSSDPLRIVLVELSVNRKVIRADPASDSESTLVTTRQPWNPPAPGEYTIQVRAQNSAGVWGESASKIVTVLPERILTPVRIPPTPETPFLVPLPLPPGPTSTPTRTPAITVAPLPPLTISFVADPSSLVAGQCSTLRWQVTNASQIFLNNVAVNLVGTRQECPTQTTTFTLRVITLDNQIVQRTATISVLVPTRTPTATLTRTPVGPTLQVGCAGTPNIQFFTAQPTSIPSGASSTLSWGAVTNADSVEIDQGIGGVGTPGSATVSPTASTVYTLIARCKGTTVTAQAIVNVIAAPLPTATNTLPFIFIPPTPTNTPFLR